MSSARDSITLVQPTENNSRSRLLVVDDNPDTREYVQACLESSEFEVALAADGLEGLACARAYKPDAILLDLSMPGMDGLAVARALKADPNTETIPVLMLTVHSDPGKLAEAFAAGADDYLVKPFDQTELKARLQARIRHAKRDPNPSWDNDEQQALLDLTRMLASSLDLNELLHLVAVRTAKVLNVDRCAVVLLQPDGLFGRVVAASEDVSVKDINVSLNAYPEIREVIKSRRPLVVRRVQDHPELRGILPILESKGIGSIALFPMIHGEDVDGVLFLRSERFQNNLEGRDIFFADAVAGAVALALRNMRIANELKRTKHFLESMIDSSVDAIIASDMEGKLILFNKGAERITGYSAEEVIGKMHIEKLYPVNVAREVMRLLRDERNGGVGRLRSSRKELLAKDQEVIPIHLTAWSVLDEGKVVATAGVFTDLRERLKIERKLSQAQEKLLRTEQQAVIAELAGATAHELNQPLTSVLGYAEMARRKLDDKKAINRIIDTIISEAERMADIVRKIGRITRYETKSYVGGQRIVDLDRSSEPDVDKN